MLPEEQLDKDKEVTELFVVERELCVQELIEGQDAELIQTHDLLLALIKCPQV